MTTIRNKGNKNSVLNNKKERKRAAEIHTILTTELVRPISRSSANALDQIRKLDQETDIIIAETAPKAIEDKIPQLNPPKPISRKLAVLDETGSKNLKFPKEIWTLFFINYLGNDLKSQSAISRINKGSFQLFQMDMFKARLINLLKHVLYGSFNEVKKILEESYQESKSILENKQKQIGLIQQTIIYRLLCTIDTVVDPSGRTIEGTPFRMAIGAKDVKRSVQYDGSITTLIAFYMKKIPNGESLILNQIQDQKLPEDKFVLSDLHVTDEDMQNETISQSYYDYIFFQPLIDAITIEEFKGKSFYQYYYLQVSQEPTHDSINALLPFRNQAAFVRFNNDIYYLDRNNLHLIKLIVDDIDNLNQELKPEKELNNFLTTNELHTMQRCVRYLLVSESTEFRLNEFRKKLKSNEIIKTGFHFDDLLLLKAFEKFNSMFDIFGGCDSFKNNLFWRQVIGYIQRYLPACTAQDFCQDLTQVPNGYEKTTRSLNFIDGTSFYSASLDLEHGLGFEYAALPNCSGVLGNGGNSRGAASWPRYYRKYLWQKNKFFEELASSVNNPSFNNELESLLDNR